MLGKLALILLLLFAQNAAAQVDSVKTLLKGQWQLTHYKSIPFKITATADFVNIEKDSVVELIIDDEFIYFIETSRYQNKIFKIDTTSYFYHIAEDNDLNAYRKYKIQLHADKQQNIRSSRLENILSIVKVNHSQLTIEYAIHAVRSPMLKMANTSFLFQKATDTVITEKQFEGEWFYKGKRSLNLDSDTIVLNRDTCFNELKDGCKKFVAFHFNSDFNLDSWHINSASLCGNFKDFTLGDPNPWSLALNSNIIYLDKGDKTYCFRYSFLHQKLYLIKEKN